MRRFLARFSESEASNHMPSLADFITATPELKFFGTHTRLGVRLDRVDWAFRHADPAIDAFVRVDDEHVLALVETVYGAHVDAVHDLAANTALVDDEGQLSVLSADRSGELIHRIRPSSRCSFIG